MSRGPIRSSLSSLLTALPWCCIAPAVAALAGLATAGMGAALERMTPLFLLASVGFLGRALYLTAEKHHGPRWVRGVVWTSSVLAAALWIVRFGSWIS